MNADVHYGGNAFLIFSRGQLGHGSVEDEAVPLAVSALEGVRCVCVAAGGWHCAVVSGM